MSRPGTDDGSIVVSEVRSNIFSCYLDDVLFT
jgi:hypothetical protein